MYNIYVCQQYYIFQFLRRNPVVNSQNFIIPSQTKNLKNVAIKAKI